MAKSALELAVNTGQWDAGLKKAQQSLNNFTEASGGLQQAIAKDSENMQKFVRMMGSLESTAKTAKGQMNDYKSAIEQLTMQYNRMTDAQKKTIGQDYLASIDKLKQKYQGVRESVNSMNKELSGSGGLKDALNSVAGQFGLNIEQLTKFGGLLATTGAAMKVAKDAFFASEATVDEWGRTVEASRSLYEGFLTALNNSDISGYLTRMDQIVEAARQAYNELDRLGTMKTIQGPAMSAQQAENDRMRQMIMTGRYIAPVDGRNAAPGMVNGQRLTAEQIRAIERNLQGGMQKIVTLVGNEVKQTNKAIDARYSLMAKENGMTLKEFRQGTSSMAEFDKRIKAAAEYEKYERAHTTTTTRINPTSGDAETVILRDNTKNPYEAYKNWSTFRVDKMGNGSYNDLVNLIRQRDQQAAQAYSMQSQAYRTINRAEGTTVRDIMNGGSGSTGGKGGGTTTTAATEKEVTIQQQIAKLEQEAYTASDERRAEIAKQVQELDKVLAAQKAIRDEVHGTVKEQQMATGISGLTPEMIATGQADIKKQMQTVELGSEEYNDLSQRLIDYNTVSNLLQEAVKSGLEVDDSVKEYFVDALTGPIGENIPQALYDSLVESLNEFKEYTGENPIELNTTTGNVQEVSDKKKKGDDDALKETQKVVSGLSQVASGLQAMGIILPSEVTKVLSALQGAMTVVQGVNTMISVFGSTSMSANTAAMGANTGAIIANTAAMAALEAALYANTAASWIPFAEGGVVHAAGGVVAGTTFSGDQIPAMLNAGEVVLNRAQVGNLAEQLEDNERQGGFGGTPYVTGEQIFLGLNNYLKGAGYGQLVTSNG